jgi:glycosyltransferase involved in cell wall biosynthesis
MPQPIELYRHLMTSDEHYDVLLFIPYLYPSTYYGALIRPGRSVIWPCLHDETMAYYHLTRVSLSAARGLMFNTEPERALAAGLGVRHPASAVIGTGIDPFAGDGARFRADSGLMAPYIVYSGRLDLAKNVPQMVDYFIAYKRTQAASPLKLVLMGEGPAKLPDHPDIVPIGVKQGAAMHDVLAGALALCQPSLAESFSIVMMESWMVGRPVLVHSDCAVTADHVRRSGGGWAFRTPEEFARALETLEGDAGTRERMGAAGRAYVTGTYAWDAVVDRFEAAFAMWTRSDAR